MGPYAGGLGVKLDAKKSEIQSSIRIKDKKRQKLISVVGVGRESDPPQKFRNHAKIHGGAPRGPKILKKIANVGIPKGYLPAKFHPFPVKNVAARGPGSLTFGAP